jgi:hypothetical protein|tara:strand:+ start:5910 stop:6074 length:165 start_codon:yes stop_codon:yes gene_type:complete
VEKYICLALLALILSPLPGAFIARGAILIPLFVWTGIADINTLVPFIFPYGGNQ